MKKLLSLALVLVMVLAFSACGEEPTFRNVSFGMSVEQVKAVESALTPVSEKEQDSSYVLEYSITYNSEDLQLIYAFGGDKLAGIIINCDDVNTLKSYLTDIFGRPDADTDDVIGWNTEEYDITLITTNQQTATASIVPNQNRK